VIDANSSRNKPQSLLGILYLYLLFFLFIEFYFCLIFSVTFFSAVILSKRAQKKKIFGKDIEQFIFKVMNVNEQANDYYFFFIIYIAE
jgi:hypothetical protein